MANVRNPEMINTDLTKEELNNRWISIDWKQIETTVSNLQARIARAALEKRWKEVNKLVRLLTLSYHAKLLAVRQVTTSKGKNTPGVDGITWKTPEEKMHGALNLNGKGYRAMPLKRIYIPKKNGKFRPLSIPTIRDRAMQALYALALAPIEFATGDRSSFGFRKSRSSKDACEQVFKCLSTRNSAQWILEADIKACFDMISHDWLMNHIPMKKSILKQFLKAGFLEGSRLFPTTNGTPQGGNLSPILANMVLNGIERLLGEKFYRMKNGTLNKSKNRHKVNMIRYADDIIITADSKTTAEEVKQMLIDFLQERGLHLSEEKTLITHISEGFTFLGWEFRKFKIKLQIRPSKDSIKSYTEKVHNILRKGRSWTQDAIISTINPITRGWCNYHRHLFVYKVFSKLDYITWNMLYAWAKRRHPNEPRKVTVKKYWHRKGSREWIFSTETQELILPSSFKTQLHRMVQLDKNPFLDYEYFEEKKRKRTNRLLLA